MLSKEIVLKHYPDARVCCGDDGDSRIIMRPGQALSQEFKAHEWDDAGAENDAWHDAAYRIKENQNEKRQA